MPSVGKRAARRVAQRARRKAVKRTEPYMPNPWIEESTPISYMPTLVKVTPARKRRGRGGGTELRRTPQRAFRLLMKRYKKPGNIPTLEI